MSTNPMSHPMFNKAGLSVVDGRKFCWCNDYDIPRGVAERSDLGYANLNGRIYLDACDTGFIIRSHRTGEDKVFYLLYEIRDETGEDLQVSVYAADMNGENQFRGAVQVHVLNT